MDTAEPGWGVGVRGRGHDVDGSLRSWPSSRLGMEAYEADAKRQSSGLARVSVVVVAGGDKVEYETNCKGILEQDARRQTR